MIDAKDFDEEKLEEAILDSERELLEHDGLIDIPGVGIVGSSGK